MDSWSEAMMSSLINLSPRQFSDLTHILAVESHYKLLRLSSLLRSPRRFSQLFRQLETLPLHQKYMLISRMLLRSLARITQILEIDNVKSLSEAVGGGRDSFHDFDAGLLLILLSEVHGVNRKPTSPAEWQAEAVEYFLSKVLSLSGLRVPKVVILGSHIEELSRFRRLLEAVSEETGGKTAVAAASAATVVSLPRITCRGGEKECVICREELEEGSEGCLLPCSHVFHCHCILRWLRSRNTCPSCRFELPTDDVVCEIERLCRVVTQMGKKGCQAMNEGMP